MGRGVSEDVETFRTVQRDDLELDDPVGPCLDRTTQIALFTIDFDRDGGAGEPGPDRFGAVEPGGSLGEGQHRLVW
jgi:hypothetical protein